MRCDAIEEPEIVKMKKTVTKGGAGAVRGGVVCMCTLFVVVVVVYVLVDVAGWVFYFIFCLTQANRGHR